MATKQMIGRLPREHGGPVYAVSFSRDGRYLASGGDGTEKAIRWPMSTDEWRAHACDISGRTLTPQEWHQYVGPGNAQPLCPKVALQVAIADVHNGDADRAQAEFADLVQQATPLEDWNLNNEICWFGGIEGYAAVAMPACERAVSVAPPELRDELRDSRGLVRARLGEVQDAIQDFQAFVDAYGDDGALPDLATLVDKRKAWIAALQNGQDPFDPQTLRALESE
jgi:hypothetical protein